jgi:hypothetical protein
VGTELHYQPFKDGDDAGAATAVGTDKASAKLSLGAPPHHPNLEYAIGIEYTCAEYYNGKTILFTRAFVQHHPIVGKTPLKDLQNAIRSSFLSTLEPKVNQAAVEHSRGDKTTCFCTGEGCGGRPGRGLPLEVVILLDYFAGSG